MPASDGERFRSIVGLVAKNKPSVDFCGYWQRHIRASKNALKDWRAKFDGRPARQP